MTTILVLADMKSSGPTRGDQNIIDRENEPATQDRMINNEAWSTFFVEEESRV